ncbi:hypothetical protein Sjap_008886 [Stephania japonica]|uniref:Uncharacterized protein n=1 Tax=Stephania japonica TaxID=461633 RepID=A0AAP0PBT3_9MAGN
MCDGRVRVCATEEKDPWGWGEERRKLRKGLCDGLITSIRFESVLYFPLFPLLLLFKISRLNSEGVVNECKA